MPIAFACPHCGKQYRLGDESAGKRAKCTCGQLMKVPDAPPPSPPPIPMGELVDPVPEGILEPAPPQPASAPPAQPALTPLTPLGPTPAAGYARRFGGGPLNDRDLVGSFMTFLGWAPPVVVAWYLLRVIYVLCVGGRPNLTFLVYPMARESLLWLGILQLLAMGALVGYTCWLYVPGGIGIIQGKSEGVRKGTLACYLFFAVLALDLVFKLIAVVVFASGLGAPVVDFVFRLMWRPALWALVYAAVPGLLLWWCLTKGASLRR